MKKLILTTLLVICIILCMTVAISAEIVDSGTCGLQDADGNIGDNLTWILDDTGTLTISGVGEMSNYKSSGNDIPWSLYLNTIVELVIDEGVTSIGEYAFANCTNLSTTSIADSVLSINNYAFFNTGLLEITLSSNLANVGSTAFLRCDYLSSIAVDEENLYYSTDEFGVLYDKEKTLLIQYPVASTNQEFYVPNTVTTIDQQAFTQAKNLKKVFLSNSVTLIDYGAFGMCANLESIDLANVVEIGNTVFRGCQTLVTIDIPESVTKIGDQAFYDCTSLESVLLPNSITNIGNSTFYNCTSLKNISLPDGITSIGNSVFYNCTNLENINLPSDLIELGNYVFSNCTSLKSIYLPEGITALGMGVFYNCTNLENVKLSSNIIQLGNSVFNNCTNLKSILLPESITSLGTSAFCYCSSLESVILPSKLTELGDAVFGYCTSLNNIVLPNNLTSIGRWTFSNCESLKSVNIPDSVLVIGQSAFGNCTMLEEIKLSRNLEMIDLSIFSNCTSLASIELHEGITSIGNRAFYNCSSLSSIDIPSGVLNINSSAFEGCVNLSYVNIESLESWCKIAFGNELSNPLYYVKNLYIDNELVTNLVIPSGVNDIKDFAFVNCEDMRYLLLPSDINSISEMAFVGCENLTDIYFDGSINEWTPKTIDINNMSLHCLTTNDKISIPISTDVSEIKHFANGSGTELDPYIIYTAEELAYLADIVNSGVAKDGCYYELGASIDLSGYNWIPIGTFENLNTFNGYFDGKNNAIIGLYINRSETYLGLFGLTGKCGNKLSTIKNLNVFGDVTGNVSVGGICGNNANCTMSNCTFNGNVNGKENVGGIAGWGSGYIEYCKNMGTIFGDSCIGGISGSGYGITENCANYGKVTGYKSVGGIKGHMEYGTTIQKCFNKGIISIIGGENTVGGISGACVLSSDILNCYNMGTIIGGGGGITGQLTTNYPTVKMCYNTGDVINGTPIIGYWFNPFEGEWANNYFLEGELGVKYKQNNNRGTSFSVDKLTSQSTFSGFDFTNVWIMTNNGPQLRDNRQEDVKKYSQIFTDKDQYIYEHINFIKSGKFDSIASDYGFYNAIWENQDFKGIKTALSYLWGVTGNIGELLSFNFGDLKITADIYDMYVTDLVLDLTDAELAKKWDAKAFSIYDKYYSRINTLLGAEPKWISAIEDNPSIRIEAKSFFSDPNYELSSGAENILSNIFDELFYDNYDLFEGIFEGLDNASKLCDLVKNSNDLLNGFRDAQKVYTAIMCYKELDENIANTLYEAADEMEKSDPRKANQYRKSIKKYSESAQNDDALLESVLQMMYSTGEFFGEKALEKTIKPLFYSKAASFLGVSVADFNKAVAVYLLTYDVMDLLTNNSEKTDAYLNISYLAPLENAFFTIAKEKATELLSKQDLDSAMDFDNAYLLLKKTNERLYDQSYRFAASKNQDSEMYYSTLYKNEWIVTNCHTGIYVFDANDNNSQNNEDVTEPVSDYKYIEVHCPVDVYLYENDELIVSVVDETINLIDSSIITINGNEKKAFIVPSDRNIDVEIVPRENGIMEYCVKEVSIDSNKTRTIEFYDLHLVEDQVYMSAIPSGLNLSSESYKLQIAGNDVSCNYDSSATDCETIGHSFGEMLISETTDNTQYKKCSKCGKKESYSIEPKIETGFYYDVDTTELKMLVSVSNSVESNEIVVAQYANGKLLEYETVYVSENRPFTISSEADTVKTMLWHSFDSIIPVSENCVATLSEIETSLVPIK